MTWNIDKVSHAELYWICVASVKAVSDEYEKGLSDKPIRVDEQP